MEPHNRVPAGEAALGAGGAVKDPVFKLVLPPLDPLDPWTPALLFQMAWTHDLALVIPVPGN